ncbi:MAG: hypothetical protein ACOC3Z_02160 [Nanoarchaeota archaeon]
MTKTEYEKELEREIEEIYNNGEPIIKQEDLEIKQKIIKIIKEWFDGRNYEPKLGDKIISYPELNTLIKLIEDLEGEKEK